MTKKVQKSEDQWKGELDPELYRIAREKGTEPAFSGKYYECDDDGVYHCAACDNPLFTSDTKYHSGSGWPSFYEPISEDSLVYNDDTSHGMRRTEVCCGACDAHLGHVFPDGPQDKTGERYCINSISLKLNKKDQS